ncbi:unnamed protein product [Microthlaspi erraticum]|uniref:Uncharacterized protein n=1 Tax=Microthlaspi erraticum TaxID=1685480 RepID=A0A6D2I244_9BRAS|nr:unnamed protein product [Microthlaspi erraticum]
MSKQWEKVAAFERFQMEFQQKELALLKFKINTLSNRRRFMSGSTADIAKLAQLDLEIKICGSQISLLEGYFTKDAEAAKGMKPPAEKRYDTNCDLVASSGSHDQAQRGNEA